MSPEPISIEALCRLTAAVGSLLTPGSIRQRPEPSAPLNAMQKLLGMLPVLEEFEPIAPRVSSEESAVIGMVAVIDGIDAMRLKTFAKIVQLIG